MATKPTDRILDWASGGSTTDPGAGKEATGWVADDRPPANWWNWILNSFGQWLSWAEDSIDDLEANQIVARGVAITDAASGVSISTGTGFNMGTPSVTSTYVQVNYTTALSATNGPIVCSFRAIDETNRYAGILVSTTTYIRFEFRDLSGTLVNPQNFELGVDFVVYD